MKALIIPDCHIPAHNVRAYALMLKVAKDFKPDEIVILGDFGDFYAVSAHGGNKPDGENILKKELRAVRDKLRELERLFPKAKKVYCLGNHEDRLSRYIIKESPALYGMMNVDMALDLSQWEVVPYGKRQKHAVCGSKLYARHEPFSGGLHAAHGTVAKGLASVVFGHCFDEETEILTDTGWKYFYELSDSDQVTTMNLETKLLEYNDILAFYEYDSYEKLHKIKTSNIDLMVTDKHGMVDFSSGDAELIHADEITKKDRVFVCAGDMERVGANMSDDEIRLMTWIAADGSFENRSLIRFHLKKQRKIDDLCRLLDGMGILYSKNLQTSGTTKINFNAVKNKLDIFKLFNPKSKILPEIVRSFDKHQANILLDTYAITDGTICRKGSYQLCSSKEYEIDMLQEVFVTNGIRCNKTPRTNGWILCVNTNSTSNKVKKQSVSISDYDGKVYCVSVANRTLLIRRNGKVCITQNTHRKDESHVVSFGGKDFRGFCPGWLGDKRRHEFDYMKNPEQWTTGFALVTTFKNGNFFHQNIDIVDSKCWAMGKIYEQNN